MEVLFKKLRILKISINLEVPQVCLSVRALIVFFSVPRFLKVYDGSAFWLLIHYVSLITYVNSTRLSRLA